MADPGDAPTQTASEQAAAPPDYPAGEADPAGGVNLPLLLVLLGILLLVSLSNVWLRRRAEREGGEAPEDER
jgi:hypothetical protein